MTQIDKASELATLRAKARSFTQKSFEMAAAAGFAAGTPAELQEALDSVDSMPEGQLRQVAQMADMLNPILEGEAPSPEAMAMLSQVDMSAVMAQMTGAGGVPAMPVVEAEGEDPADAAKPKSDVIDAEFE